MGFKFTYEAHIDRGKDVEPLHLFYFEDGYAQVSVDGTGEIDIELYAFEEEKNGVIQLYPCQI